jgi:hypothetical protein
MLRELDRDLARKRLIPMMRPPNVIDDPAAIEFRPAG